MGHGRGCVVTMEGWKNDGTEPKLSVGKQYRRHFQNTLTLPVCDTGMHLGQMQVPLRGITLYFLHSSFYYCIVKLF